MLLALAFICIAGSFSQSDFGIFLALPEGPGVRYEYKTGNNFSHEIRISGYPWISRKNDNWNGGTSKVSTNFFYSDYYFRKFISDEKEFDGVSFGGYLRYYRTNWTRQGWDEMNAEQKREINEAFSAGGKTTSSETLHKISIGGLAGYRMSFTKTLSLDIKLGLGFTPPPLYWEHNTYYLHPDDTERVGRDWLFGYANHLSLMLGVGLSFTFL